MKKNIQLLLMGLAVSSSLIQADESAQLVVPWYQAALQAVRDFATPHIKTAVETVTAHPQEAALVGGGVAAFAVVGALVWRGRNVEVIRLRPDLQQRKKQRAREERELQDDIAAIEAVHQQENAARLVREHNMPVTIITVDQQPQESKQCGFYVAQYLKFYHDLGIGFTESAFKRNLAEYGGSAFLVSDLANWLARNRAHRGYLAEDEDVNDEITYAGEIYLMARHLEVPDDRYTIMPMQSNDAFDSFIFAVQKLKNQSMARAWHAFVVSRGGHWLLIVATTEHGRNPQYQVFDSLLGEKTKSYYFEQIIDNPQYGLSDMSLHALLMQ